MAIEWKNEPILDSVQLPGSETKYWVADKEAREMIETVVSATHFLGVTTTALTDESATNPIDIKEGQTTKSVTAVSGDITIYKQTDHVSLEFIFDGTHWQLLGGQAIEGAGALAYKDSASGSYTPSGSITLNPVEWGAGDVGVVTDVSKGDLDIQIYATSNSDQGGIYVLTEVGASDLKSFVYNISTSTKAAGSEIDAGSLPTLTGITANGLTVYTDNTTLVFGNADADVSYSFNAGAFPTYSFASVTNIEDITYSTVMTRVGGSGSYIYGTINGNLDVTYGGVTGTFDGSAATITVS